MKLLNKLNDYKNQVIGGAMVLATTLPAFAEGTDPDYSTLTSAVNFTAIIAVVLGLAGVVAGWILVKNNIGSILGFIRRFTRG
ncbi:hypothetical protein ABWL39_19990 [Chitinivorax sp. PXF-14]|uniref:hypothetical protein n=1 Tax=Chitinivorax sp. PXF-14 TaxID=3230488 RepID=UPI0034663312